MDFKQWNRVDRAIFTAAAVLLLLFSYFLYDDSLLFPHSADSGAETVGQIAKTNNDVRQKNRDAFAWTPAFSKQSVRNMDSIFTGENSEAQIKLNDGTIIKVKPNSLVTINMNNGQMQLDLKYGDILGEISAKSNIKVKVGNEEVKLKSNENAAIQVKKGKDGKVDLDTLKGKAVAETNKGSKEVKQAAPPKISIKDLRVTKLNSTEPFDVPWQTDGTAANSFNVVISPDAGFANPVFKKTTEEKHALVQPGLTAGNYFWKVVAYKEDGSVWSESPAKRIYVTVAQAPQWIQPAKDGNVTVRLKEKGQDPARSSVRLQWSDVGLPEYEIETATDANFQNVIQHVKALQTTGDTPALATGDYYFRVRGTRATNATDWSVARHTHLDVSYNVLTPPVLSEKEINFTPPLPSDRRPASEQSPRMGWSKVDGADSYLIQLSSSNDFTSGVQKELPLTNFNWEKYTAGQFFFRVKAKNKDGAVSDASEVGILRINLNSPIITPLKPINVAMQKPDAVPEPQHVTVNWSQVARAPKYELEIDTNPKFKSPIKVITRGPASVVTVPKPGEYHLRVKALSESGRTITSYSPTEKLTYNFKRQLASPSVVTPIKNLTVFLQKLATPFIRFEWKPVADAQKYEFELSGSQDFASVIVKTESKEPRTSVRKKLPSGPVFWRVRAVSSDPNFSSQWTEPRQLHVQENNSPLFIE